MDSKRFWKPVWIGAAILALAGFLFSAVVISAFSCPASSQVCAPSLRSLVADVIYFGWPAILGGALAGAIFGMLYAVIRRGSRKEREAVEHSG